MPDDTRPNCEKCGKPKTAQRTGTVGYWLCVPCYKESFPLEPPQYRAAETFPRGPSNEQTLLSELGQCKAERDALAVTAEGLKKAYHLQLKGMESMAELMDGLKQDTRKQAEKIQRLRESLLAWLDYDKRTAAAYDAALAILKETAP